MYLKLFLEVVEVALYKLCTGFVAYDTFLFLLLVWGY